VKTLMRLRKPGQQEEVEEQPRQPSRHARQADAERQVGHGRAAADGGHGPLVEVPEPAARLAPHLPRDALADEAPRLLGDRRQLGQQHAALAADGGQVTDDRDVGRPGTLSRSSTTMRPPGPARAPARRERVRPDAGGPHQGPGRQHLAAGEHDVAGGHLDDPRAEAELDPSGLELSGAVGPARGR
jgi:hypothetical protein